MIAAWMGYALAVSLLLGGAALGVERALAHLRLPVRGGWAVAMLGSAALPLLRRPAGAGGGAVATAGAFAGAPPVAGATPAAASAPLLTALDAALLAGWLAGSLAVVLFLGVAAARLGRRHRRWRGDLVAGEPVRVSREMGPAVVGFLAPEIVLPAWALGLPAQGRRLLVLHERSHLEARDPLLVLAGLAAAAALPWNLPLWWQLRRLRAAVEMDCDARLLRAGADAGPYGLLLLEVARRVAVPGALATAFAASRPLLARRIAALADSPRAARRRARLLLGGGALAATAMAAALPVPGSPLAVVRAALLAPSPEATPAPPPGGASARPRLLNRHETPGIVNRFYPGALREAGVGGVAVVWAFVDRSGSVRSVTIAESSSYPELDDAARRAMRELRFEPARRGGRAVSTWLQHPITFVPRPLPDAAASGNRLAIWTAPAMPASAARLR